jgi:serine phosphatase RsbU (regulator of sigma subunit)
MTVPARRSLAGGVGAVLAYATGASLLGPGMVPMTTVALAPLVVSMYAATRATAAVGALAVLAATFVGVRQDLWESPEQVVRVVLVAAVAVLAVALARHRIERMHRLDRSDTVRELSSTLQTALLPAPLVDRPGLRVHGRYLPGERRLLLGGDFYDVAGQDDGTVAFVIGDVVGHGPAPAASAAELRAGWRALVSAGVPFERWLPVLNRVVRGRSHHPGFFVTCLTGVLDPVASTVRLATAGHPCPFEVGVDGATCLGAQPGPPLGVLSDAWWPAEDFGLGPGALLLYTDGLVEGWSDPARRSRVGQDGLKALLEADPGPRRFDWGALDRLLTDMQAANGAPLVDDVAELVFELVEGDRPYQHRAGDGPAHSRRQPGMAGPSR